jgi:hypothetical protein
MIYHRKDEEDGDLDDHLHQLKENECFFFNLLQTDSIFVNGKLDKGIFCSNPASGVDSFLSIVNTLSILTEVSKIRVNMSMLALGNIFSLVESIIKLTKNLEKKKIVISNKNISYNPKPNSSKNLPTERDLNNSSNSEFTFRNQEKDKNLIQNVNKVNILNTNENSEALLLSTLPSIPIEEFILDKIESVMKKMKINIEDIELNILTDNHLFKQLTIKANSFNMFMKNSFNNYFDQNRTKLISTIIEIKLGDLNLFSSLHGAQGGLGLNVQSNQINNKLNYITFSENKMTKLTSLPQFSIVINQDLIYDFSLMRAEILSNILSELSEMDLAMTCKDLDSILSLVMCLVKGIETIEKAEGQSKKKSSIESYTDKQSLRFNYSNLNLCLYNHKLLAEINKFNLDLEIFKDKFLKDDIKINFSPIWISFTEINTRVKNKNKNNKENLCEYSEIYNKSSYFTSTMILEGLKIHLEEDKQNSNINILFPNVDVIIYDDHLIEIISFVSSFLNFILEESQMKKFNRLTGKTERKNLKKEKIKLEFKNMRMLKYLDYDDIISAKIPEMNMLLDDYLIIPKIKFYHQTNFGRGHKHILENKTKVIEILNLKINFFENPTKIDISIEEVNINYYCIELAGAISKIMSYYLFFPDWIDYYFIRRFIVDQDTYKQKFVFSGIKKDTVTILFERIKIEVKDFNISSAGILNLSQSDYLSLESKSEKEIIEILKKNKRSLLTVLLTNFNISVEDTRKSELKNKNFNINLEIDTENNNAVNNLFTNAEYHTHTHTHTHMIKYYESDKTYYKSIHRKSEVSLHFSEITVLHEAYKVLASKDLNIFIKDEINSFDYNFNKLKNYALSHKHHTIFYKDIYCTLLKDNQVEITTDNLLFNFEDVKIFDQIINLLDKVCRTIEEFPYGNYKVNSLTDQKSKSSTLLSLDLYNLEGGINSVDPKTKKVYNKLILKINFFSLLNEINETKSLNAFQTSVHYLSFGFDPSQKSGYPLIIIPLAEVNIDNVKNDVKINIPSTDGAVINSMRRSSQARKASNYSTGYFNPFSTMYDGIYQSELHNLLMKTKSITLFLNFKYLSTFVKIFGIFWTKTKNLRKKFDMNRFNKTLSTGTKDLQDISGRLSHLKSTQEINLNSNEITTTKIENSNNFISSQNLPLRRGSLMAQNLPLRRGSLMAQNLFNTNSGLVEDSIINDKKIMLSVFDIKIVYLLEYKEDYATTFKFHPDIISKGYFGYIFRLYSFSLKYKLKGKKLSDSLHLGANLFTLSFLSEDNFNDDIFFKNDREIYLLKFTNLKEIKEFNEFMELDSTNECKFINKTSLFENSIQKLYTNSKKISDKEQVDLLFDNRHTLVKISGVSFKRKYKINENIESISILVENLKLTWNKFNKDVLQLLLFDDVFLIVDKIILQLKVDDANIRNLGKTNSIRDKVPTSNNYIPTLSSQREDLPSNTQHKPKITTLDLGKFNFVFELHNPQIVIQNEIKKSTLLLTNKEPCKVIISKLCLNETRKEFKLEVVYDKLGLYSAPNYMDSKYIYFIGNAKENAFYLEESMFKNILEAPKIRFKISQFVKSKEDDEFDVYTNMNINVERINCDFEGTYFIDFMNIIEVFIFDRGYSFAEQINSIDLKKRDLKAFKFFELENMIKLHYNNKTKKVTQKEITFSIEKVILNMSKGGKPMIQLQMQQFEGEHLIYPDKGTDTKINIKDLQIKNIEKTNNNRSDLLLAPFYMDNFGEFEDKLNILMFRKKDSYVKVGTGSEWYTVDYFELSLRPLRISISKAQIEFILEFFFRENTDKADEEEQRNLLMHTSKFREKTNSGIKKEDSIKVKSKEDDEDYPIYFKQFKVNETELLLSFEYAENSSLVRN